MKIIMIACIYGTVNDKEPAGFRLLDMDEMKVIDVPYKSVYATLANKKADIINVGIENGKLKGLNGNFDRYSKIVGGKLVGKSKLVILSEIGSLGYTVCDHVGNKKRMTNELVIAYANVCGIANGKVVKKLNGDDNISAIRGSYDKEVIKPKVESNLSKEEEEAYKKAREQYSIPKIRGDEVKLSNTRVREIDPKTQMTIEQKIAKVLLVIKSVRPFYYAVLQSLKRKESVEINTMGVTLDSLYFNAEFVKEITLPQLLFAYIHEVCHISMQHPLREQNRDHELWNVACDLYINKLICEEFSIKDQKSVIKIPGDNVDVGIQFIPGICYNSEVSVKHDTPEKIYEEMLKENKNRQKNKSGKQGDNQEGKSGQQGGTNPSDKTDQSQGAGQGQRRGEMESNSQGSGNNASQGSGSGQAAGQGQPGQGGSGQQAPGDKKQAKGLGTRSSKTVKFRGKEYPVDTDIVADTTAQQASDNRKKALYDSIMKKAKVLEKQMRAGKGKGHMGVVEAFVDEALVPKVNWRSYLMNRMTEMVSQEKSLSTPDRRFIQRGLYVEGNRLEEEKVEGIKLCIDTSGSMTDQDIAIAFAQINHLLKSFKLDAEIIFWDDGIQAVVPFDDYNSLLLAKCKATGRGGTDPNCVFKLFEQKEYKIGLKQRPSLIVMFTDGYFEGPKEEYGRRYGRDTLWIISGENTREYPFGTKAKLKLD